MLRLWIHWQIRSTWLSISIQTESVEFPWQRFTASWQRESPRWRVEHPDFLSASRFPLALPWIQNHPFSSLSLSAGSRPQFLTCLADTQMHAHTHTPSRIITPKKHEHSETHMHKETSKHNPCTNKSMPEYFWHGGNVRLVIFGKRRHTMCLCHWGGWSASGGER